MPKHARRRRRRPRDHAALLTAAARCTSSELAALTIARTAEERGADFAVLAFVAQVHDICERHERTSAAVLTRDPKTGAYGGALPAVIEALRPALPSLPADQLTLAYDAIWQARHGALVPPDPGPVRRSSRG